MSIAAKDKLSTTSVMFSQQAILVSRSARLLGYLFKFSQGVCPENRWDLGTRQSSVV